MKTLIVALLLSGCASLDEGKGSTFKDDWGKCHFVSDRGAVRFDVPCQN